MSAAASKAPPRAPAPRKPRAPKAPAGRAPSRLGRLGSLGWAALLGVGVVVLTPIVHAFWGDAGVLVLLIFGLGFLLGRWTAA